MTKRLMLVIRRFLACTRGATDQLSVINKILSMKKIPRVPTTANSTKPAKNVPAIPPRAFMASRFAMDCPVLSSDVTLNLARYGPIAPIIKPVGANSSKEATIPLTRWSMSAVPSQPNTLSLVMSIRHTAKLHKSSIQLISGLWLRLSANLPPTHTPADNAAITMPITLVQT